MAPTYKRHPMDKRRPARAPRSRKRRSLREARYTGTWAILTALVRSVKAAARACQADFALVPPQAEAPSTHARAASAVLDPDPRQETTR